MVPYSLLRFLVLSYYLLPLLAEDENEYQGNCPTSFHCGKLGDIHFPFTNKSNPECGLLIKGCDDENVAKEVQLGNGRWYVFETINWDNSISVIDYKLQSLLSSNSCDISNYYLNATLPPSSPIMSFQIEMEHNITLFRCDTNQSHSLRYYEYFCDGYNIYYPSGSTGLGQFDYFTNFGYTCSTNQLPSKLSPSSPWTNLPFYGVSDLFSLLTAEFRIQIVLSGDCRRCYENDGQCRVDKGKFVCVNSKGQSHSPREKRWASKVNIAIIGLAMGFLTLMTFSFLILFLHKRRYSLSDVQNQTKHIYSGPNSNPLPESGIVFFGTRVFSHRELKEVTNNFDEAKELGSGGFGTVYYGKLRDGREVAVKRLYQHNYRQVEQFMNEIEILTRLRHRNLVSLYGCSSRHSHELLLVYEYVPNGTVACHLHGDLAKAGLLSWPIRMKIAIETASALTYLHASDIIHRDVKTNNILLDNNFCVKVADFGLSRLFPNNVTHVSTAPQGTPGYLDPEYHQCYQLTSKSDVYSFGVVLIELISSLQAVDITRDRDEINLSNLAIKKIQKRAFSELVDPSLGFELDKEFKRKILSVAELAFQCLQADKDLRPSMVEVLEVLKRIDGGEDKPKHLEEADVRGSMTSQSSIHSAAPTSWFIEEFEATVPLQKAV